MQERHKWRGNRVSRANALLVYPTTSIRGRSILIFPPILTMRLSRPLLFVGQFPTYSATSRNFSFVRSGVMYLAVKRTKSKRDPSTYLNRKESIFMDIAMKLQQILLHLYYTPGFSFRISSFKLFAILNFTAVFVARLLTIISYFNIESGTYVLR